MSRVPLTFRIFKNHQLLREETLALGVIKIGKVASAHLRLDDETVSRMHAILEIDHAGNVHVIDLGSTRGTFVNGQKINKAKLQSGDSITLGDMRVELSIGARIQALAVHPPDVQTSGVLPSASASASSVRSSAVPHSSVPHSSVRSSAVPSSAVPHSSVRSSAVPHSAIPTSTVRSSGVPTSDARSSGVPTSAVRASAVLYSAVETAVRSPATPAAIYGDTQTADDMSGAQAIEIAAMLGDSVVGVKHCIDPNSGKISARTWGMFAAGVACLATSASAFYLSVQNAAFNKGALEAWTHLAHRPAFAYRPHALSLGYDWLAFGGFAVGLVMMALGLVRMRNEKRSPYFRIGTAPGVELPLGNAPATDFPLVAPSGDDFVFNYGGAIDGEMIVDGKTTPLCELAATGRARPSPTTAGAIEVPIPARARIRARLGQTSFVVSAVPQPRRHVTPLLAGLESRTMSYFAGSLAVHLAIWGLLQQMPVEDSTVGIDLVSIEPVGIVSSNHQNDDVPPPKDPSDGEGGAADGQAAAMKLPEGAAGTTQSTRQDSHMRMKDENMDPQLARAQAIEEARNAGILGESSALRGGAFASITSTSDLSSGIDEANVYGAMFGAEGEGQGSFGYGRNGTGGGGGCTVEPCGIIGVSKYGTISGGTHAGDGWGLPGHGHGMRGHDGMVPHTTIGQATGSPDIDKATIRRYIRRNLEKIGYCYNKEVLARPSIAGELVVSFFISPDGSVKGATSKGFDATVGACVADVVSGIEFPRPKGGGGVEVNYPFSFHTTGQ